MAGCGGSEAQSGGAPVAFKLGTFERSGRVYLGLVLGDTQAVDIAAANAAYEAANASAAKLPAPADMKALDRRLRQPVEGAPGGDRQGRQHRESRPRRTWPRSPTCASTRRCGRRSSSTPAATTSSTPRASPSSSSGPAPQAGSRRRRRTAPGIWERPANDTRDNPYLFQKSPTVVTGPFDPIVMPRGRTNIDFECEFGVVIGAPAKYVTVANAANHIFGYTVEIDVSDRGGRGDRKMGGSDWLIGKNHDTFGPLGPFIVPKEFLKDPMNTRHTFTLNETVMQDSNTSRMSHNIHELLSYASNILTLNPGDVIAGGSPAGTNIERAEPRWMRAGDTAICAIEGVGTQRHPVVGEDATR